jgi:type II secretory pathway pseudopilin PulG
MKKFTLLELLIVIGIIAILISLLLPSLDKTKELTRRAVCLSNLQQLYRGQMMYAKDYDGRLAGSVGSSSSARHFKAKVLDGMGLYDTPLVFGCPNWKHDTNDTIFELTEAQRRNALKNNSTVMLAYHMLTGSDIHNQYGGAEGWNAYKRLTDESIIPLIADRTASPTTPYRTKLPHTGNGGRLEEVSYVLNIKQFGLQGQNEVSLSGGARWVYVDQLVPHNISSSLRGFWSRDY